MNCLGSLVCPDDTPESDRMIAAPIVFDERVHRLDSVEAIYRFLVARIESCVSTNNHGLTEGETTILVDSVRPLDLSVVKENASWDNLISMLIFKSWQRRAGKIMRRFRYRFVALWPQLSRMKLPMP